jgi:hypothetical protein
VRRRPEHLILHEGCVLPLPVLDCSLNSRTYIIVTFSTFPDCFGQGSTNCPESCFVLMQHFSRSRPSQRCVPGIPHMRRVSLVLLAVASLGGCASHGWRRTAEGAGIGGGGAALAGEILTGPVGLAAGALAGSGAGAVIASKTQTTSASKPHYHNYVPVYAP